MKARDLLDPKCELNHKVRTVSDLIRHIKTRELDSETPNYNLFLGAGCSVSSGIRPASKLTEEWMRELYERFKGEKPSSVEEAEQFFIEKHSNWYNKESAYSSLFEKTYEFPTQRRRFVEKEVGNALPAIGYAYLTSLVGYKFFNTIFTTNFDDLINEAFYQFSNSRPLLCAHDSSIRSISITSKRPKIIKLHGDYLFDDIKSTLRETESLEQNTKEKLIEYCKEFGLIVVGYAGNDKSIMDVLDFLTKQDNFLKNGVYWCLRKDAEISHILQNLFWREKVYPVIIDGFDELLAEIHTKLIGKGLDFETSIKNSKLQKIKKKILENNNLLSSNKFIQADIKNIKESNNKQELSEFLASINANESSSGLSLSSLRNLIEVEDLLKKLELDKAYELAEEYYYGADDERDKTRYISMLISISDRKDDSRSCLTWCDKLIEINPHNISFIIKKSVYTNDLKAKYSYLSDKAKFYSTSYRLYLESARAGRLLLENDPRNSNLEEAELLQWCDMSLKLNPSLSNNAWVVKLGLYRRQYKMLEQEITYDKHDLDLIDENIQEHIDNAEKINPSSFTTIEMRIATATMKGNSNELFTLIDKLYEIFALADVDRKIIINEHISDIIQHLYDSEQQLKKLLSVAEGFYEKHLSDKDIKNNAKLMLGKATYFIASKKDLNKAKSYFISALDCSDIVDEIEVAVMLNKSLGNDNTEKLLEILEGYKGRLADRFYFEVKHDLMLQMNDYNHAREYLEKSYQSGKTWLSYIQSLSYLFIKSGEYQKLLDFEEQYRDTLSMECSDVFRVNYQFAAKSLGSNKYDEVYLRNLSAGKQHTSYRLGAFAVLGQRNEVKRLVSELISISYLNYFTFKTWPIIEDEILHDFELPNAA